MFQVSVNFQNKTTTDTMELRHKFVNCKVYERRTEPSQILSILKISLFLETLANCENRIKLVKFGNFIKFAKYVKFLFFGNIVK